MASFAALLKKPFSFHTLKLKTGPGFVFDWLMRFHGVVHPQLQISLQRLMVFSMRVPVEDEQILGLP